MAFDEVNTENGYFLVYNTIFKNRKTILTHNSKPQTIPGMVKVQTIPFSASYYTIRHINVSAVYWHCMHNISIHS